MPGRAARGDLGRLRVRLPSLHKDGLAEQGASPPAVLSDPAVRRLQLPRGGVRGRGAGLDRALVGSV